MRRFRWLTLTTLACLIAGVLATSLLGSPQIDQQEPRYDTRSALIWLFRYKRFIGAPLEPVVFCDDQKVAKMDNGRYFLLTLNPGVHTVRSTAKTGSVTTNFESGREYFLEVYVADEVTYTTLKFSVGHASRYRGLQALQDLEPLKPVDIIDAKRVTSVTHDTLR
jgi:hypothetical protein